MSEQPVTDSLEDRIIRRIADGEPMYKACEAEGVKHSTFLGWVTQRAELADKYARARECRAELRADQIDELASKVERGELDPQAGRVVIDARKWAASKLAPKRYGERIAQEITGADGGPIRTESKVTMAPDEAYKALLG